MKRVRICCLFFSLFFSILINAQYKSLLPANQWTDSVFNSLNDDQKIAQLIVIRAHSNLGPDHVAKVVSDIQKYNVGALCFFQGGPVRQALLTNYYQGMAKTPLMVTIDAEWGLGMRLDSVTKYPYQLTLGAIDNENIVYRMGIAVGEQCKRLGVHVNYAPVVDINNNPANPVIGYRSFGEDREKVSKFGVAYMKGMQDAGIIACAKHFPGHGDVDVDSHLDLPVVNKSKDQLDSLELVPFKALFDAGVSSVMIAHLSVPSIDNGEHRATSISKNTVTGLLRNELGYQGLTFTDALEMKGVAKYFPGGTIAVEALIAGNDMLCLPSSVPDVIDAVKKAIAEKRLGWDDINAKVKKVLQAKYKVGLNHWTPIDTTNLLTDLNSKTDAIRYEVAKKCITVLTQPGTSGTAVSIPINYGSNTAKQKIAYVGIGCSQLNAFGKRMKSDLGADTYLFSYKDTGDKARSILKTIADNKYDLVITGIHDFNLRPASNYSLSDASLSLWKKLNTGNAITLVFGNVLATANFCDASSLMACYQDDDITQSVAADILEGKTQASGRLPVRVCKFKFGDGIVAETSLPILPGRRELDAIDSIAKDAIAQKAFPGCVILAAKDGKIIYHKAFGNYEYGPSPADTYESIFDLASVTKVSATTISIMKLYDQGRIDLKKTLGDYLPWVRGSNKAHLPLEEILLHQAGLVPFIPFYKETIDTVTGIPNPAIYSDTIKPGFSVRVAQRIYLRDDWNDTIFNRILKSPLGAPNRYVYSDNDFIFLGKIVEAVSGMSLDQYVYENFYKRMGLVTTGFKPRNRFAADHMVPTEVEDHFRRQLTQGDVHDEGAALLGGVAGHAGLFSDAYDLAMLFQMLLNGGELNGVRYLQPETINLFTAYHSKVSRRGYGFDKPEKDNAIRKEPYPALSCSPLTFGHTGFTGTCVWVDPKYNLIYILLSNRVYPTRDNNKMSLLLIRGKIQEAIYHALGVS